ncbi:hypothetical protein [Pelagicoccus albus]|uniref:Uncharacterized protein n=1 Tax=Pelagicoccus albus TaxID=415222 RepID=A0A7X1B6F0_9BACT|nr:hypothetical protein [Pelagicoccus albus]MBC2606234.1 hypothetical protein [Pelagicoccus albus]
MDLFISIAFFILVGFGLAVVFGLLIRSAVKKDLDKDKPSPEAMEKGRKEMEGAAGSPSGDSF